MPNFRCSTIGSPELSEGLSSELTPESASDARMFGGYTGAVAEVWLYGRARAEVITAHYEV